MSLQVTYSDHTGSTIDISDRVAAASEGLGLAGVSVVENAEEGSVGSCVLVVDDENANLELLGHRRIYMIESSAPAGNQNIGNWFTAERTTSRGDWHVGPAARAYAVTMADENTLLERRLFVGTDSNRPAETDIQRVAWLLTTTEMNQVDDDTYVATTGGVAMDAVDYSGQRVMDVLRDCAEASGRNYFVWYNETLGEYSLWYNKTNVALYDSAIRLTNAGDQDNPITSASTTFAVEEATLTIDPSRVYSGVLMEYQGPESPVYVQRTATGNEFAFRDAASSSMNVKTLTKATARATRWLEDNSDELHVVRAKVVLPASKVTAIKKGMRVQCYFTHLGSPYSLGYAYLRVLNLQIDQITPTDYRLHLEMTPPPPDVCPAATPAATFPPLLNGSESSGVIYGDATGNVQYLRPGIAGIRVPTPFNFGRWHFPDFNVAGVDYAGDCTGNEIRFVVVGDGTLTIPVTIFNDGIKATLYHYVDGIGEVVDEVQGPFSGAGVKTFVFNISTSGNTICTHWVDVEGAVPFTCGGYLMAFGPVGATWEPSS